MVEKEMEQFLIDEERRTIKALLYLCDVFSVHTTNTRVASNIILCKTSLNDVHKARVDLANDFVNCIGADDPQILDTMLKVKFLMEALDDEEMEGEDDEPKA